MTHVKCNPSKRTFTLVPLTPLIVFSPIIYFQHEINYPHEKHVKGLSTLIGTTQSQV
jgi:hypothetical protein